MNGRLFWVIGLVLAGLLAVACGPAATPAPVVLDAIPAAPAAEAEHAHEAVAETPVHEPAADPVEALLDLPSLPKPSIPPPITRNSPDVVRIDLEVQEVEARLADGVNYEYWTYNGTVPGPFLRVRVGDTVELTITNPSDSVFSHDIDLHAVNGPGGGHTFSHATPGESASFKFVAMNPGIYIYHCARDPIPLHISNGMYCMILVEPEEGLVEVDEEFYLMQGDLYLDGDRSAKGLRGFSMDKLIDERPDYIVFNGSVGALTGDNALKAEVGDTIRLFFGVGGPNLTSSLHVIGEIFDRVYPEGALNNPHFNVETTLVPAGGAVMTEFKVDVPGKYLIVDHSLSRLYKGAVGEIIVTGPENSEIYGPLP